MTRHETTGFLSGVVEGFYGQPWTRAERLALFDTMAGLGLDTYLYAAKDDLHHRARWRHPYSASDAGELADLVGACTARGIRFIYGIGPGLDIRYSRDADFDALRARIAQMLALGCRDVALLFDDVPDGLAVEDRERWGTLARAQSHVTNALFTWTRERAPEGRFLFCPTPYCGRMVQAGLGGEDYLHTIGRDLLPGIDVLWTGPEIVSREITVAHVREVAAALQRPPVIWDNLHANDYDGRRFYCGPYSGRPPQLRAAVRGVLVNPNNELPLNHVALHTLSAFLRCETTWHPRTAYLAALADWLPAFATTGRPIALDDLTLFADGFYLPYEEGPEAEALHAGAATLLSTPSQTWGDGAAVFLARAARLRELCVRMTELRHRPLFYALSRRIWDLREELDLLEKYVRARAAAGRDDLPFRSDFHQPGTYRGGLVNRLQRLLVPQPDGTFAPARAGTDAPDPRGPHTRAPSERTP